VKICVGGGIASRLGEETKVNKKMTMKNGSRFLMYNVWGYQKMRRCKKVKENMSQIKTKGRSDRGKEGKVVKS